MNYSRGIILQPVATTGTLAAFIGGSVLAVCRPCLEKDAARVELGTYAVERFGRVYILASPRKGDRNGRIHPEVFESKPYYRKRCPRCRDNYKLRADRLGSLTTVVDETAARWMVLV